MHPLLKCAAEVGYRDLGRASSTQTGVGLWFTLVGAGIRAEYERHDIDELDRAEILSVSAFNQF